ncbi:hypothetical protein N0V88_005008 [Collariella sp. IMI 366227]|nr:hypothetical protein N0V88_005008 [Collariella sp. IMI 366227]
MLVRALHAVAGKLTVDVVPARYADVGYDFLIDSHFTAVEWRDDIKRLRAIAGHDRLRGSIRSLTFNLSKPDDCNNGRHTPPFHTRTQTLEDIFQRLPNLHTLEVTVPNNHHNITTPTTPAANAPTAPSPAKT